MPYKLPIPASFLQYHPEISPEGNEQMQRDLIAHFSHMCRCSMCEKKGGLFYEECCSRILCDGCHRASRCNGQQPAQTAPAQPQRELEPVQTELWEVSNA